MTHYTVTHSEGTVYYETCGHWESADQAEDDVQDAFPTHSILDVET